MDTIIMVQENANATQVTIPIQPDTRLDQILIRLGHIESRLAESPTRAEVVSMVASIVDERTAAYLTATETQNRIDSAVKSLKDKIGDMLKIEVQTLTTFVRNEVNTITEVFSKNTRHVEDSFRHSISQVESHMAQTEQRGEERMENIRNLHLQSLTSTQDLTGRLEGFSASIMAKLERLSETIQDDAIKPITDLTAFKKALENERLAQQAKRELIKDAYTFVKENKWVLVPIAAGLLVAIRMLFPDVFPSLLQLIGG